jgi:hypothetical protein
MKSASFLFVLVVTLSCASDAHASASLAEFPKALRQTYADGSFTEVECSYPPEAPRLAQCEFRVSRGHRVESFRFSLSEYGDYRTDVTTDNYNYWNYWDYNKQTPFVLAFKVDCGPEDLKLIPGATEDNSTCRIFLEPYGKRLLGRRVEISTLTGDRNDRMIPDQNP